MGLKKNRSEETSPKPNSNEKKNTNSAPGLKLIKIQMENCLPSMSPSHSFTHYKVCPEKVQPLLI